MKIKKLLFAAFVLNSATLAFGQTFGWAKTIGGTSRDFVTSMSVDAAGNVYTLGGFSDNVDFDPGSNVSIIKGVNADIFISKLDAAGNFVWAKKIGGANINSDYPAGGQLDKEGNFIVSGYVYGDMNETTGEVTEASNFYKVTSFVAKINADGNYIWIKRFDGDSQNSFINFVNIDVASSGNVYLSGTFKGTCDFDPGAAVVNLTPSNPESGNDLFICKLDATGNFVWAKSVGNDGNEQSRNLIVDTNENVYITGGFEDDLDFDPNAGVTLLSNPFNHTNPYLMYTAFICKYSKDGNLIWAKSIDGNATMGYALALDNAGNLYAGGTYSTKCDINPGLEVDYRTSAGGTDAYLCKITPDGVFLWAHTMGGSSRDYADIINALAVDTNGDVYASGSSRGGAFPSGSNISLNAFGTTDVFVIKFKSNGDVQWAEQVGGRLSVTNSAMKLSSDGSIHLAGQYEGVAILNPSVDNYDDSRSDNLHSIKHRSEYTQDTYIAKWTQDGLSSNRTIKSTDGNDFYPNSTNGLLYLSDKVDRSSFLEVFNSQGQHIIPRHKAVDKIDLSNFNSGIYFVRYINAHNESITTKIVKQ